ncbi:MAG: MATE family efflux transporter [Schaedlerella sp.]|nr:MATE family efflux transporter [Lachnospiraceae bacterium]MDY4201666.1 MATE family efflux transporter [Schaedlerella sp.]
MKKNITRQEGTDLGTEPVGKLLIKLAFPAIIAQMVNLLYNMVDRIYIGHIPGTGDVALTGLGLCFPIIMIITAFSSLIGTGGAPRAAIFMGKGDDNEAERILGNCTSALVLTAVVLTVVMEIVAEPVLRLFGASSVTLPYALSYMRIYVFGTICVMLALGLNSFITTQGFSKIGMKTVIIGAVCNLILDPILIFGFNMGVRGAALATILSQGISAIWVIRFLTGRKTKLKIRKKNLKIQASVLLPVLALGISPFIMTATESILNVAFNSSLSRYGGDIAVGAMTILSSVMQLQFMPVQGLGQGAQPILSYNYGAKKIDRVKKSCRILIISCLLYTFVFWGFVQMFPEILVRLFNNNSPELISTTAWALRIYMAGTGVFGIQMAIQQIFMALGQAKLSLLIACMRKIILLIPLIYILPHFFVDKVFAVFLAEPAADLLSVIIASVLFAANYRKILSGSGEKA